MKVDLNADLGESFGNYLCGMDGEVIPSISSANIACGFHASDGSYANMRGVDISEYTAPVDRLFLRCRGIIPTIGVGDGGNEIGMGKIPGVIKRKLNLDPCMVATDILVIASVSNWGAYGIVAALEKLTEQNLLPEIEWVLQYIKKTVDMGSVDGVTKKRTVSVDGKDIHTETEILNALKSVS